MFFKERMETMFGISLFLYIAVFSSPSGDVSAGKEAARYRFLSTELIPRAYYCGCFSRHIIRPGEDDRKRDHSDRTVRLQLNGCRSRKYREAESSPSLWSIAVAAIARDSTWSSRKLHRRFLYIRGGGIAGIRVVFGDRIYRE